MVSAIIAIHNQAPVLARMFAPLITAVAEGLVKDVVLADQGSSDDGREIAEAAGCRIVDCAGRDPFLAGSEAARGDYFLLLKAGAILQADWIGETTRFMQRADARERVASFRVLYEAEDARLAQWAAWLERDVLKRPSPRHGAVLSRAAYESLGGGVFAMPGWRRSFPLRASLLYERAN